MLCLLSLQLVGAEEDHHEKCGVSFYLGSCPNVKKQFYHCKHQLLIFTLCYIFLFLTCATLSQLWAGSGECEANPNYMLKNCAHSCEQDRIMMSGPPEDRHSK